MKDLNITSLHTPLGEYHGKDTLEGFAGDAELLGRNVGEKPEYDNTFYKLCIEDNKYIFELKGDESLVIPKMRYEDLEKTIKHLKE